MDEFRYIRTGRDIDGQVLIAGIDGADVDVIDSGHKKFFLGLSKMANNYPKNVAVSGGKYTAKRDNVN